MSTLDKHVLPLSFGSSLTEMSAGELLKFLSYFLSEDGERAKEFIQSISWASKSEAVNVATLRKIIWVQH